ncbi:Crp/Fnr family transcriptional regulator [Candidatus Gracilibacteria bacterium]|nr:Crp/Fnr family transcriptional regulator [Candidatus Gracilibacteria bacterium]
MEYSLFEGLSEEEIKIIEKELIDLEYKKKETIYTKSVGGNKIFYEESSRVGVYFVESGIVKISVKNEMKNYTIAFLKGGDFFGEMSSILGFEPTADIHALEDVKIKFLDSDKFNELLNKMPKLGIALSKYLAKRTQFLSGVIFDHVFKTLEARVASNLLSMIDEFGEEKDGKFYLKIKVTHQDLADFIGTNRETVTKTLNIFKKNGILDFIDRRIVVLDFDKLKEISVD